MELTGLSTSNRMLSRVLRTRHDELMHFADTPVLFGINPIAADLDFVGQQYKPTLRITGAVTSLAPQAAMPYDIKLINMHDNHNATLDYEFSTEQLKSLVDKGLYLDGFNFDPSPLLNAELVLSGLADVDVLPPAREGEPPIVGVNVHMAGPVSMTLDNSGYDLEAELFDNYAERVKDAPEQTREHEVDYTTDREDIFADEKTVDYIGDHYSLPGRETNRMSSVHKTLDTNLELESAAELDKFEATLSDGTPLMVTADDTFGKQAAQMFAEEIERKRREFIEQRDNAFSEHNELASKSDELDEAQWDEDLGDVDFDDEGDEIAVPESLMQEAESEEVEFEEPADDLVVDDNEAVEDIFAEDDAREAERDKKRKRSQRTQNVERQVDSITAEERGHEFGDGDLDLDTPKQSSAPQKKKHVFVPPTEKQDEPQREDDGFEL